MNKQVVAELDNEEQNRLPDCVYLAPELKASNPSKLDLNYQITFGEHLEKILDAFEIRFTIKSGELQVNVVNGNVQQEDIEFIKEFASQTKVNVSDEVANINGLSEKFSAGLEGGISISPSISSTVSDEETLSQEREDRTKTEYSIYHLHIRGNWHPTNPRWHFFPQLRESCLYGRLDKQKFAAITVANFPLTVDYKFIIKQKDIVFTGLPLHFKPDNANANLILKILLFKFLIGSNAISEGTLSHGTE